MNNLPALVATGFTSELGHYLRTKFGVITLFTVVKIDIIFLQSDTAVFQVIVTVSAAVNSKKDFMGDKIRTGLQCTCSF